MNGVAGISPVRVFLSYRRGGDAEFAAVLADALEAQFGDGSVFHDQRSIPPGEDFRWAIEHAAQRCEVMVVLIGPEWNPKRVDARHMLGDHDFVRREVATALARGIRVLPVLLDDALVPAARDLPNDLASLTTFQAVRISLVDHASACRTIANLLVPWLPARAPHPPEPRVEEEPALSALERLERVLADDATDFDTLAQIGARLIESGHTVDAERCYQHLIDRGRDLDHPIWIAHGHSGLGRVAYDRGEYVLAEQHVTEGLTLVLVGVDFDMDVELVVKAEEAPSPLSVRARLDAVRIFAAGGSSLRSRVISVLYSQRALLAKLRGDLDDSEYCQRLSMALSVAAGDVEGAAARLLDVGDLRRARGDLNDAEGLYRAALSLSPGQPNPELEVTAMSKLARLAFNRGLTEEGARLLREASDRANRIGSMQLRADLLRDLGNLYLQQGSLDAAERVHLDVLRLEQQLHRLSQIATQHHNLAIIRQRRGDDRGAEALYRQALQTNEAIGRREGIALQCSCLGVIYSDRGDFPRAGTELTRALREYQAINHARGIGQTLVNLAALRERAGQLEPALTLYREAAAKLDESGEPAHQARAWAGVLRLSILRGDLQQASETLGIAESRARAASDRQLLEHCSELRTVLSALQQES